MVDVVRRRSRRKAADRSDRRDPLGQAAENTRRWAGRCAWGRISARRAEDRPGLLVRPGRLPGAGSAPGLPDLADAGHRGHRHDPALVGRLAGRECDARHGTCVRRSRRAGRRRRHRARRDRQAGMTAGPVAAAGTRMLFFVTTRGAPVDEDEWWSCRLDCEPENITTPGQPALALPRQLRPGPAIGRGRRDGPLGPRPGDHPLPDSLRLLPWSTRVRRLVGREYRRRRHRSLGSASAELFERACAVTPGGVNSPVRAFGSVGGVPRFIAAGAGPYLTDVDGREYVDLVCSWGPMILGHAYPAVVSAARGGGAGDIVRGGHAGRGRTRGGDHRAHAGRAGPAGQFRHRGHDVRAAAGPRVYRAPAW